MLSRSGVVTELLGIIGGGGGADAVARVLELGCRHFGMELGIASHITGTDYRVDEVWDAGGIGVERGARFDLGDTYCRDTLAAQGPMHHADASRHGHPCYLATSLKSYIGTPVRAGGLVYGTINFSSRYEREPFTAGELQVVQLMALWLGSLVTRPPAQATDAVALGLQQLASGFSHEIGNPLAAMMISTTILREEVEACSEELGPERAADMCSIIDDVDDGMAQLQRFLGDLRALSWQATDRRERCVAAEVIEGVVVTFARELDGRGTVERRLDDVTLACSPAQLTSALLPVYAAAVHAIGDGGRGRVELELTRDGDRARLAVRDNGHPIPAADLPAVFAPFYSRSAVLGASVGYASTYAIVTGLGGTVSITSTKADGTCVTIDLPALD